MFLRMVKVQGPLVLVLLMAIVTLWLSIKFTERKVDEEVLRKARLWEKEHPEDASREESPPASSATSLTTDFPPKVPDPEPGPAVRRDILSGIKPGTKKIFFLETSCIFNNSLEGFEIPGGIALKPRSACAVYSAALMNPDHKVYIFNSCPLVPHYYDWSKDYVKKVLDMKNVFVVNMGREPGNWFKGTTLEGFEKELVKSSWQQVHASDALRSLLLWKYGGTYLDTDTITLRSFNGLGENWATPEDGIYINSGIMNLAKEHPIAARIMNAIKSVYMPRTWMSIGPYLLTMVFQEQCEVPEEVNLMSGLGYLKKCSFTLYPYSVAHPRTWRKWEQYYQRSSWEGVKGVVSKAFVVHFWNNEAGKSKAEKGSAYDRLAEAYCSRVHSLVQL